MNEDTLAIVIFVAICASSALIVHWRMEYYWAATILSALLSVILFQVVAYLYLGYLETFFLIAVVTSGAAALVISVIVGVFFKVIRDKSANDQSKAT